MMGGEVRVPGGRRVGGGAGDGMHGARLKTGGRQGTRGGERTGSAKNMYFMFVTLEVSKLRG